MLYTAKMETVKPTRQKVIAPDRCARSRRLTPLGGAKRPLMMDRGNDFRWRSLDRTCLFEEQYRIVKGGSRVSSMDMKQPRNWYSS